MWLKSYLDTLDAKPALTSRKQTLAPPNWMPGRKFQVVILPSDAMTELLKTALHEASHALCARHYGLRFNVSLDPARVTYDATDAFRDAIIGLSGPLAERICLAHIRGETLPAFRPDDLQNFVAGISPEDAKALRHPAWRSAAVHAFQFVEKNRESIIHFAKALIKIEKRKQRKL